MSREVSRVKIKPYLAAKAAKKNGIKIKPKTGPKPKPETFRPK
jgi:hypothetical protein